MSTTSQIIYAKAVEIEYAAVGASAFLQLEADATLLSYAAEPTQAFADQQQDLIVTITNPVTAKAVTFNPGPQGEAIYITFPETLARSANFNAQSQTNGFYVAGVAGQDRTFSVTSLLTIDLKPGDSIVAQFKQVPIVPDTGDTEILIEEFIGSGDEKTSIPFTVISPKPSITAYADPNQAGYKEPVRIHWDAFKADSVTIEGLEEGKKTFKNTKGDVLFSGDYTTILTKKEDLDLTLTAVSDKGDSNPTHVTVSAKAPVIHAFQPTTHEPDPLPLDAVVSLTWRSEFALATIFTSPDGNGPALVPPVALGSPIAVNPGKDAALGAASLDEIPATAEYSLVATGFDPQASGDVSFTLGQPSLVYFKYLNKADDDTLSGMSWQIDPTSWDSVGRQLIVNPTGLNILKIFKPGGGHLTYYLGSGDTTHPQIQYFNADKVEGGQVTISWVTANLSTLVLNPGDISIDAADIPSGSKTVQLPSDKRLTLTGTSASGDQVPSILVVTV